MERYSAGLLSDLPRKNAQTMASTVPRTTSQRLEELVTHLPWKEKASNRQRVAQMRDEVVLGDGVLIVDDASFVKQETSSVGVGRPYCGTVGKVANGQVAVSCVYADRAVHWPVSVRLYLPLAWAEDRTVPILRTA